MNKQVLIIERSDSIYETMTVNMIKKNIADYDIEFFGGSSVESGLKQYMNSKPEIIIFNITTDLFGLGLGEAKNNLDDFRVFLTNLKNISVGNRVTIIPYTTLDRAVAFDDDDEEKFRSIVSDFGMFDFSEKCLSTSYTKFNFTDTLNDAIEDVIINVKFNPSVNTLGKYLGKGELDPIGLVEYKSEKIDLYLVEDCYVPSNSFVVLINEKGKIRITTVDKAVEVNLPFIKNECPTEEKTEE